MINPFKFWQYVKWRLYFPVGYAVVNLSSLRTWLISLNKPSNLVFENEYCGQKIILAAIYEKGVLREDVMNMFETAKKLGAYVLCVNTMKLENPKEKLDGIVDCYIERFNYGRDFGSYKKGFLHIFQKGWHKNCPRVLMLNDSVFYSKKNLESFLSDMLSTEIDVLGATENHEIHHHFGSFCISIGSVVINHKLFRKFWSRYSNTDVRPRVIYRGEMGLSKTLRRCATSQDKCVARYGCSWFSEYLSGEKFQERMVDAVKYSRQSSRIPTWPSFPPEKKNKLLMYRYKFWGDLTDSEEAARNQLIAAFLRGSQIHQNASILHNAGLPIIKLDLLYRGMFDESDVELISKQLDVNQLKQFKELMYSKPFGGNTHNGMQLATFMNGII